MKMEDANGNQSSVFKVVEANGLQRYRCRLCTTDNMDFVRFISHARSKNHELRLRTIQEKHSLSKKQRIGKRNSHYFQETKLISTCY